MNTIKMKSSKDINIFDTSNEYLVGEIAANNVCTCSNDDSIDDLLIYKNNYTDSSGFTHMCNLECGCLNGKLMLTLASDCTKDNLIAGAQIKSVQVNKKKKEPIIKAQKQCDNMIKKADIIKKLAEYIANTLPKSPLTYNEHDIYRIVANSPYKDINLTNEDMKNIIGLSAQFYKNKTVNHSLLTTININASDLIQQLRQVYNLSSIIDYDLFLNNLKVSSVEYQDVTDCNYIRYISGENSIPSIIFALFSTKIPVLFDIVINQDLYQLQQELQTDDYSSYRNIHLLLFRLSDRDPYFSEQSYNNGNKSDVYTELSRILLSMSIKRIISKIMEGVVTSSLISPIMNIFKNLYIKNVRTYQESLLSAILKIWSFKPTVILKNIASDFRTESVFFVEYNISEYNQFDNQTVKFTQDLLKYIYYDIPTNKVILSPKFIYDSLSSTQTILPINSIPCGLFRNIQSNNTLKSIGVFILSIPRLLKRSTFGLPDEFSDRLLTKYVDIDQNITIGCDIFQLRSAVCYKLSKYMDLESCAQNLSALGTVAIVKTQKGWIRYNPDLMYSCYEKKDVLEKIIKNKYYKQNNYEDMGNMDDTLDDWKKSIKDIDYITERFDNGYVDIDALIISESEAIDTISRYGTIVIYAQEYTTGYDISPLRRF